jgi:hypothetical protein
VVCGGWCEECGGSGGAAAGGIQRNVHNEPVIHQPTAQSNVQRTSDATFHASNAIRPPTFTIVGSSAIPLTAECHYEHSLFDNITASHVIRQAKEMPQEMRVIGKAYRNKTPGDRTTPNTPTYARHEGTKQATRRRARSVAEGCRGAGTPSRRKRHVKNRQPAVRTPEEGLVLAVVAANATNATTLDATCYRHAYA